MSACEKCWAEASFRARVTSRMAADVYREVLAENDDNPDHLDTKENPDE